VQTSRRRQPEVEVGDERDGHAKELPSPVVLAHELRSHLAAINLGVSHVRRRLSTDDPGVWRSLEIIDRAIARATELTTWVLVASHTPEDGVPEQPTAPDEGDEIRLPGA
jgi:hypothetical protein